MLEQSLSFSKDKQLPQNTWKGPSQHFVLFPPVLLYFSNFIHFQKNTENECFSYMQVMFSLLHDVVVVLLMPMVNNYGHIGMVS